MEPQHDCEYKNWLSRYMDDNLALRQALKVVIDWMERHQAIFAVGERPPVELLRKALSQE